MKKKLFDLEFDENYELIQEGSVRDPLVFYDDEEVVQEADENIEVDTTETVEEPAVEKPSTEEESIEVTEEIPAEEASTEEPAEEIPVEEPVEEAPQSTDTLPEDFWYTRGNSAEDIGKPVTDEDIANAEKELGYKLPESYKSVIKQQNGGRVNRCVFPYNGSCIEIDTLFGIDHDKPSLFETGFYVSEWGYPDIGLTVASTPSAGHDMVFLDYSECGKDGEPSVVVIDQELDYRKTKLADNFGEFINKLVTRDEYDQMESSNDTSEEDVHLEAVAPAEPTVIRTMWEPNKLKNMKHKDAMSSKENIVFGLKVQNKFLMKVEKLDKSYVDEVQSVEEKAVNTLIDKGYVFIGSYGDGHWKETLRWVYVPKTWFDGSTDNCARCLCCEILKNSAGEKSMHIFGEAFDHDGKLIATEELYNKPFNLQEQATQESYVQEDGETSDEQTVGEAIEAENETPDTGSTTTSNDFDFSLDLDVEDALEGSTTPEGDDLKDFGTDTSDVQNEYDPKEIDILNKLIAAEGEAINDYFDAAKDSHDSNARRLYSDIGHEERFHMEQLLFQKAQFTGEKYEPRDPEVKKEYEELLQMGMDDETAMHTAVNKVPSPDDYTTDFVEYANDLSNTVIDQAAFIIETAKYMWEHRADKSIRDCGVVLESHFYQEEMINMASSQNKKDAQSKGPLKMIADAFKAVLKSLSNFTKVVRGKEEERRLRNKRRREWIQKNGWEGLFKGGRSFYFYSPKDDAFNMVYPCQYVDLLYRLSVDIGKKCGVTPTKEGYHGTMKNPIRYNSIEDGMAKIKNLKPTATKIVITDKNKDALLDELFGYSDKKIDVAMWNEELNRAIYESNNVYNKITAFQCVTKQYAEVSNGIYDVMDNLQNNANSIAWKDKITYNKYMKWMSEILAAYTNLLNAAQKDLEAMDSIPDSGDVKGATASRDMGNKLPEGEPDRRTSGSNGNNAASNKYAKSKK